MAREGGAKSFPMFPSYIDALRRLDLEDRWSMVEAMNDFATTGAEPEFTGGNVVAKQIAWDLIVPTLERSVSRSKTNARNRERKTKGRGFVYETEGTETKGGFVYEKDETENSLIDKEVDKEEEKDVEVDEKKKGKKKSAPKHRHGEYGNVSLTDDELAKLEAEFPADWRERVERLDAYIEQSGKRYKSHLAVIRNWARKDSKAPPGGRAASGAVDPFWGEA